MAVAAIDMSFMEDSDMFLKKETNAARPEAWSVLYLDVYWSFFFFQGLDIILLCACICIVALVTAARFLNLLICTACIYTHF